MSNVRSLTLASASVILVTLSGCGSGDNTAPPDAAPPPQTQFSAAAIDFGPQDCGATAPASQSITVKNAGGGVVHWSASIDNNAFFDIDGAHSGTLDATTTSATLSIKASQVPANVAAGTNIHAAVLVTTDDPSAPSTYIPVKMSTQGGYLVLKPGSADFGQIPVGTQAPDIPLTLTNIGNKDVSVAFGSPKDADFSVSPASGTVPAGGALAGLAAKFKPSAAGKAASAADVTVTGAICGVASATSAGVAGEGVVGVVGVSPATLDFGNVNCGTTAPFQVASVINTGNQAFTWTAALGNGAGSAYQVSPSAGTAPPNSSVQVFVQPKPLPQTSAVTPNLYGDTLTITTNVAKDSPHPVTLKQTAQGAILQYSAPSFTFNNAAIFATSAPQTLTITNGGNIDATVNVSLGTKDFALSAASGTAAANGGTFAPNLTATPTQLSGKLADTVTVWTTAVLCAPLPAPPTVGGTSKATATQVSVGGQIRRINQGNAACALVNGGHVACWGANAWGQVGDGTTSNATAPKIVAGISGATAVATNGQYSCALDSSGNPWCWGLDFVSQQPRNAPMTSQPPAQVPGVTNATALTIGHNMACALLKAGTVSCWGSNHGGQLGNGTSQGCCGQAGLNAVPVSNLTNVTAVSAGGPGACALRSDNTVWCWGGGGRGQLGNGTTSQESNVPVQVSGLTTASAISAGTGSGRWRRGGGNSSRCALRNNGTVVCWGGQDHGALGNGQTGKFTYQITPVQVTGITTATAISSSYASTCALLSGGSVQCWGRNDAGQLGDGTVVDQTAPVAVQGLSGVTAISAGGHGACALVSGGSIQCWGQTGFGQHSQPTTVPFF